MVHGVVGVGACDGIGKRMQRRITVAIGEIRQQRSAYQVGTLCGVRHDRL